MATDEQAVQEELKRAKIVLCGAADEAPEAYKRLDSVLAAHSGTIKIKHYLSPIGVAMAGNDVYDPYKD